MQVELAGRRFLSDLNSKIERINKVDDISDFFSIVLNTVISKLDCIFNPRGLARLINAMQRCMRFGTLTDNRLHVCPEHLYDQRRIGDAQACTCPLIICTEILQVTNIIQSNELKPINQYSWLWRDNISS